MQIDMLCHLLSSLKGEQLLMSKIVEYKIYIYTLAHKRSILLFDQNSSDSAHPPHSTPQFMAHSARNFIAAGYSTCADGIDLSWAGV